MRKFKEGKEVFGLEVRFAEGIDFTEKEGSITQIYLHSRNTSVPMIVVAQGSEAKSNGIDGMFPLCSQRCGGKMREALAKELELFREVNLVSMQ